MKSNRIILKKALANAVLLLGVFWVGAYVFLSGCDPNAGDQPVDFMSNPAVRFWGGRLTYPAGEGPYEVLVGDLNRDGRPDMVTLNWTSETASVLLAKATGFDAPVDYALGATPRAGVLADLSGNDVLDLAVVNESGAQVSILFGDGKGGFITAALVKLEPGSMPRSLVAADLNQDGYQDLVVANSAKAQIVIVVGQEGGKFLDPVALSVEHNPYHLWAGDATGDGIVDIVTANTDTNTLSLLAGNGAGYAAPQLIPCGNGPRLIMGADLNRDGMMDLLAGNFNSGDISVLYGRGGGAFSEEARIVFPAPVGRFVVADLTGNSLLDIAAILFDSTGESRQPLGQFAVALGDGLGGFQSPTVYGSGWGALAITPVKLSAERGLDLVTADFTTNSISIIYNRGDNTFESDMRFAGSVKPRSMLAADMTQDGIQDLVLLNGGANSLSMLPGIGGGEYGAAVNLPLTGAPLAHAIGDFNQDGQQDLVVSLSKQAYLMVYLANASGQYLPQKAVPVLGGSAKGQPEVLSIALADMDNNGTLDIVTGNSAADSVSVLFNDGTAQYSEPTVSALGNYPRFIHATDLNGDGFPDVVFVSSVDPNDPTDGSEPRVVRWYGKGDGSFDEATYRRYATGPGPAGMTLADISGDGKLDAITVHPGDNSAYLLKGVRSGEFVAGTRLYIGYQPVAITTGHLNQDRRLDLIATLQAGSVVARLNRGEMKFDGPNNFILSKGMKQSLVADLDGDGLSDLAVVNANTSDVAVLMGRTP